MRASRPVSSRRARLEPEPGDRIEEAVPGERAVHLAQREAQRVHRRDGVPIDRGTMCRWLEDLGATCGASVITAARKEANHRPGPRLLRVHRHVQADAKSVYDLLSLSPELREKKSSDRDDEDEVDLSVRKEVGC